MENLPVEILHRIFDNLDVETLFFSIRPICRYFRSIVHNYDRLKFDLKLVSKCHFDVLCRLVSPANIRSLTLYNTEQISLFLSRIRLRQLTRLHSISLDGIEEAQLNYMFKRINLHYLRSFSLHLTKHDDRRRKTTMNSLSTIVQQSNLRRIEVQMQNHRLFEIEWPSNCSIECLILNGDIDFENLVKIFSCSPQLHRLIVKQKFSYLNKSNHVKCSFPQLTSLFIEQLNVTIDQLELFLSLTPSLIHLKLLGNCEMFDGKRWEDFIQVNLSHLNRFEFDIVSRRSFAQTEEDLDSFVQSYRSVFWIEYHKWFITSELDLDDAYSYRIYSIPMFQSSYQYELNSKKIFLSTSNEICSTTNVSQLDVRYKLFSFTYPDVPSSIDSFFPHLTKLHLYFSGKISIQCASSLRKMLDVSQLIEVKFENRCFYKGDEDFLCKLLKNLRKSRKLTSLIVHIRYSQYEIYPHLETIMELLPTEINHLKIPIKEAKQIENLLDRCQHLSIVRFPAKRIQRSMEIKQWFDRNTSGSIYYKSDGCDHIWIGKRNEQFNPKRIKLTQDEQI